MSIRGFETSQLGGVVPPSPALFDPMVEEADAYVQGESLKASATFA
jgi:hypothetical protein